MELYDKRHSCSRAHANNTQLNGRRYYLQHVMTLDARQCLHMYCAKLFKFICKLQLGRYEILTEQTIIFRCATQQRRESNESHLQKSCYTIQTNVRCQEQQRFEIGKLHDACTFTLQLSCVPHGSPSCHRH